MRCKIGEIAEVTMGQSPKSEYYNNKCIGTPFLQGNRTFGRKYPTFDTYTTVVTKSAKAGDIIMSVRAPVGDLNITPVDICLGRGVCSLRMKNGNQEYLFYLMKYYIPHLLNKESGTVFGSVNRKDILGLEVNVAEYKEQQKIARFLSAIDEKIELNEHINKNLEAQIDSLYTELFIRSANPKWKLGTVADLGTVIGGSTPSKKVDAYYTDHGIAWITPKDLSLDRSKFFYHGETDITNLGLSNSSATIMPPGTVLFSSRAPIGYIAIAANELCTNQGFKSVVPKKTIGTAFVYCFLKANLPTIENMASGSTFKEVSGSIMKSVPATIPDQESISHFNDFAKPRILEQKNLEAENRSLATIRDSLLPRLMSGELDISKIALSC